MLWRGDREARRNATPQNNRFHRVFEALAAAGIDAEPAVYDEAFGDEVRDQLLRAHGVLVWVDPIHQGKTRKALDSLLREVAARGPWVSAHPDIILKMGVKQVLHRTKHLGWGTDTHLYRTATEFREQFPVRLRQKGPRVLKQDRGNGGQGVWKVEAAASSLGQMIPVGASADWYARGPVGHLPPGGGAAAREINDIPAGMPAPEGSGLMPAGMIPVRVLHAQRGSVAEETTLDEFMGRCEGYFEDDGCIIDQPFQPRLPEGMIRCYVGVDKVVGFGHQLIKALIPPPPEGPDSPQAQPGPRIMHGPDAAPFQALRARMETEWVPRMMQTLGIDTADLPIIWDADFLYGPRTQSGEDTYVLCEINVSSVFAIPGQAPAAIARLVRERIQAGRR